MKKLLSVFLFLGLVIGQHGFAAESPGPSMPAGVTAPPNAGQMKMPGDTGQKGMMQDGMMQMCAPMMMQMMGRNMMIRDMLQVMKESLQTQQKIVEGVSAGEREALAAELGRNIQKLERMMDEMRAAMMHDPPKPAGAPAPSQAPSGHVH